MYYQLMGSCEKVVVRVVAEINEASRIQVCKSSGLNTKVSLSGAYRE